jgi:uncharacterized protein YggE
MSSGAIIMSPGVGVGLCPHEATPNKITTHRTARSYTGAMFIAQSIQRVQGVNAFGSCLIRVVPDFASVRFSVNRVEPHPRGAFEAARTAARNVRECIRGMAIADGDVAASDTTLTEAYGGDYQNRKKIGYQAQVAFHVILRDLSKLESLLSGVVDAGVDSIASVHAKTTRLKELRREARESAVRAARAKAEVLAAAAGAKLGPVLHIEDVNPDETQRRSHAPDIDLAAHEERSGAVAAENPGSIVIAGSVMACFALVP